MRALGIHGHLLAVWSCFIILTTATQQTDPSEVNALVDIKKTLKDPMGHLRNWKKGDPCIRNWTGVWCFDKVGTDGYYHVRELYLMNMNLLGSIAPQFGQLSHLLTMNLMWNNLTGNIPKEIGNITSLKLLLLNGNNLSGNLPDELGNLVNLSRLQVDQNQLSGPIPQAFANLINVRHLHMNNNSFNGQIPHKLSKLSKLLHLLVDNNNLTGYLPPEFSMLQGLRILQLDNNNFSARGIGIPSTYANLSRLVKLSLRNCSLGGAVPDFSSIPNLSYLDLSWNHLSGPIPSNKLADSMTTIDLSNNNLNGSIPRNFSYLPLLQKLSLENNFLSGSIPTSIWQDMSFTMNAELAVDLRNNSLSHFLGIPKTPVNVTLRLAGNPICKNANTQNISQYCGIAADKAAKNSTKSRKLAVPCPLQSCPVDNFYEYVPASPIPCFCASPLRIGYQLKSPSFSYFPPYISSFELYVTQSLNLDLYQLSIYSYAWEEGPRLSMYLKVFPSFSDSHSSVFNSSEVRRILSIFTSWKFHRNDFFGPYELLNITLLGPYANIFIGSERSKTNAGILVAAIIPAVACVLAISALVTLVITRRRIKYKHKLSGKHISSNVSIRIDGMKAFTFKELAFATDKFSSSTRVGQGGYGNVYKGILSDDTTVAIKRAEEDSFQGQKEFLTEIELLSRLHHRNLVSLIGFCNEEGEQMLVYEFMPNGTLRDWISGKSKSKESLDFGTRLKIAMGSARGILYLHTEANPPIFHRDIKTSNILLDPKFTAKVADFGLSRLAPYLEDEGTVPNHVSTVVRGTPGYLDPEYLLTHKLTDKSDVYSLGIVFLELLTGMKPISYGKNIVREVRVAHQSGVIHSIIDGRMGCYPSDCVDKFLSLALSCCHDNPEERPSMLDVVRELENILGILQETETTFSDATSENSGKLAPSSSSSACNETMEGSNLVSGVIPTTVPR